MSYRVETSGSLLLPADLERQALTVLEVELAGRQGPFDDPGHVDDLPSLAAFAGAEVRREGDWLRASTATTSEPQWSDQATAFYVGLARWVNEGEVHLVGQDGARWSYRYGPDGVIQVGQNGWDGSLVPFGEPVSATTHVSPGSHASPDPPSPDSQDAFDRSAASGQTGGRGFAMTMLLLVGMVLIVGLAILGAGLFD